MKTVIAAFLVLTLAIGCVKPPNELGPSFWAQETQVGEIGQVTNSSYVLNNTNERVYTITFKVFWDLIPLEREDAILSVAAYNNGREVPITFNTANLSSYTFIFFAPPQKTTCVTFGFITSTGGYTRQFDLMCVDVP